MNLQDMAIEKLQELLQKRRKQAEELQLAECCVLISKACVFTKTLSRRRPPADVVCYDNDGLHTWKLGKKIRLYCWPARIIVVYKNRMVLDTYSPSGYDHAEWRYWTYLPNSKWVNPILEMAAKIDMKAIKVQAEENKEEYRRQYLIKNLR